MAAPLSVPAKPNGKKPPLPASGGRGPVSFVVQLLVLACVTPATMTNRTTARLRMVKTLLNLVDSWTPMLRMIERRMVMPKAVQS